MSHGTSVEALTDDLLLNTRRLQFRASDMGEAHEAETDRILDTVRQLSVSLTVRMEGLYRIGIDQSTVSLYRRREVDPLVHADLDLRSSGSLMIRYYVSHKEIKIEKYALDLVEGGRLVWRQVDNTLTSVAVGEHCMGELIKLVNDGVEATLRARL